MADYTEKEAIVRVVDSSLNLLPGASLTLQGVPVTGNRDGTFPIAELLVNDVLRAWHPGFVEVSHTVTSRDLAETPVVITIILGEGGGGYEPIEYLEVEVVRYVRDEDGEIVYENGVRQVTLVTTATLRRGTTYFTVVGSRGPGSFDLGGLVYIHDVLHANAVGFVGRTHRITAEDAYTGLIVINLSYDDEGGDGYEPIEELTVRVVNTLGILIPTASLTVQGNFVSGNGDGTFTLIRRAYVNDLLMASAIGFYPARHIITPEDAAVGIITITLTAHGQPPPPVLPDTPPQLPWEPPAQPLLPLVPRQPQQPLPPVLIYEDDVIVVGDMFEGHHARFIVGYPDGSVQPDGFITRAEASVVIFRLLNDPNKYTQVPLLFTDVGHDSWFSQAINYLAHIGVLRGYPDGTFRPNALISRAEFSALVVRFFGTIPHVHHDFPDVPQEHWASAYISSAFIRGWVTGYPDGTFRPNNSISRAEVIVLMNRVLGRVPNPATIDSALNGRMIFNDISAAHWAFYHVMEASIDHSFQLDEHGNEQWTEFVLPR
jgi:hypothetical protein